jgi:hypothetical protein
VIAKIPAMAAEPGWGAPPEPAPRAPRVEIVVSGATVLKAALIALCLYLAIVASEVLLTIGLAVLFAFGLDPLVTWFTRRGLGRGKAALLVFAHRGGARDLGGHADLERDPEARGRYPRLPR